MRDMAVLGFIAKAGGRHRLHVVASVLLLTLGIGALGAMLALYRGTFAQPPPLGHWDRLLVLRGVSGASERLPMSYPDFEDLRRDVPALEDLALTRAATVTLQSGDGSPQRVAAARVTPNLAAVLGVPLHGGAGFEVAIGQAADQVVISDQFWRGALAAQPIDALRLRVGGRAVEVVGILPPGVRFPTPDIDLWMPLAPAGNEARRDYAFTTAWGLLPIDGNLQAVGQQLDLRVAKLAQDFPQSHAGLRVVAQVAARDLLASHRPLIAVFALVSAFVFVAVAGNLAALSAARELSHSAETATRLALGASHRRLLLDAARAHALPVAIALVGGGLLAWFIVRAAEASEAELFTALRANVDAVVIAGTLFGSVLLLAAQLLPVAWILRRAGSGTPGYGRTRAVSADRGAVRGAGWIVALQLAMCFGTVGTLVLARASLAELERIDLGFTTEHRFSVALGVPELDHPTTIAGLESALAEASRLAGVESIAAISRLPLLRGASSVGLIPASVDQPGEVGLPVDVRLTVGPVEDALGLRLLRGRFIEANDRIDSTPVVVVDTRFVETWFPQREPLGARIRLQIDPTIEWQIVGVIAPARWRTFEDGEAPAMLIAAAQFTNIAPMRNSQLILRGRFDPAASTDQFRDALRRGMPLLSADAPKPLDLLVADASGQARLATRLLRLLTIMALVLAWLGVGALLLYRYERQRRAVGIRICLGASRARVVGAALGDSAVLAIGGAIAGTALVLAIRLVPEAGNLLPPAGTPAALAVAAAVVSALALLGGVLPAWRVAYLQPTQVLNDGG